MTIVVNETRMAGRSRGVVRALGCGRRGNVGGSGGLGAPPGSRPWCATHEKMMRGGALWGAARVGASAARGVRARAGPAMVRGVARFGSSFEPGPVDRWDVDGPTTLPLPTLNWVRWLIVPCAAFIALCMDRGYQTDFWQHLARGEEIVRVGQVLRQEHFTFTAAGQPIRDANWLAQVIYARLFNWGGIELVQTVNAILIALTMLLVVRMGRRTSGSLASAALAGGVTFLGLWQILLIRPQTFSLLLFVLLFDQLTRPRRRLLLIVPAIMAAWANLHGGFPIGLLLIVAFTLSFWVEQIRQSDPTRSSGKILYPLCLLLGAIATFLNPWGPQIYLSVASIASRASARGIEEWMPPGFDLWIGKAFFLWLAALVFLSIRARRWPTVRESCLALCFLPLALRSVRMVAWWMLATAPMLAESFHCNIRKAVDDSGSRPTWRAAGFVTLLLAASALSLPWLQNWNPLMGQLRSAHRTEENLNRLQSEIPTTGRVFSRLEWGGYLDCMLGPHQRVYMDGWVELYSAEQWKDYLAISSAGRGWEKALDRDGVDCLVLDRSYHGRLLLAAQQSGQWEFRRQCGPCVLLIRKTNSGDIAASHD